MENKGTDMSISQNDFQFGASESQIRAYNAEKKAGGEFVVPLGALLLGCKNCRMVENERKAPGSPVLYCAACPVTRRRDVAAGNPIPEGETNV